MFDWLFQMFANTTTTIVFFGIFLLGVTFSAMSLLFGGDDVDHDADFGGDADADGGDGGGDHDMDHDGDGGFHGVPSVLSIRGMALLATGFGGAGFLTHISTPNVFFSTAVGTLAGYGFAIAVLYAMKLFKSQQSNSLVPADAAVGAHGVVTVSVPENGFGEVRVTVWGTENTRMACSSTRQAIASGSAVKVDKVQGGTVFVSLVQ